MKDTIPREIETQKFSIDYGYVGGPVCKIDAKWAVEAATVRWSWSDWKHYLKGRGFNVGNLIKQGKRNKVDI